MAKTTQLAGLEDVPQVSRLVVSAIRYAALQARVTRLVARAGINPVEDWVHVRRESSGAVPALLSVGPRMERVTRMGVREWMAIAPLGLARVVHAGPSAPIRRLGHAVTAMASLMPRKGSVSAPEVTWMAVFVLHEHRYAPGHSNRRLKQFFRYEMIEGDTHFAHRLLVDSALEDHCRRNAVKRWLFRPFLEMGRLYVVGHLALNVSFGVEC
jgi:hypothetical protein